MTKTFDFSGLLEKVGIERKVYTTVAARTDLDIFQPHAEAAIGRTRQINAALERSFLNAILALRGKRLKLGLDKLGSGEIWTGADAVAQGCADAVASFQTFFDTPQLAAHKLVYAKPSKQKLLSKLIGRK